jgi:hypothetical protein
MNILRNSPQSLLVDLVVSPRINSAIVALLHSVLVFFIFLTTLFVPFKTQAQTHVTENHEIVVNSQFNYVFSAQQASITTMPRHGRLNLDLSSTGGYSLLYIPEVNFVGLDTFIIRTIQAPDDIQLHIIVRIVESDVRTNDDYGQTISGQAILLNVLQNDTSTSGALSLSNIPLVNGGKAEISGSNVLFYPANRFIGRAHFNYVVCDRNGKCNTGLATIFVSPSILPNFDTTIVGTLKNKPVRFIIPSGFAQIAGLGHGYATEIEAGVYEYTPNRGYIGTDTLRFAQQIGSQICNYTVGIDIFEQPVINRNLIEDHVYTSIGNDLVIFPFSNDSLSLRLATIGTCPDGTLTRLSDTSLIFSPNPDFSGISSFTYTATRQGAAIPEIGQVKIMVSNHYPNNEEYRLTGYTDLPTTISYHIPIQNYYFNISSPAQYGNIVYDAIHKNLIYTPFRNNASQDRFQVQYCVGSLCKAIDINLQLIPSTRNSCDEDDCVWPGDANNDGVVAINDLQSIASNIGNKGSNRGNNRVWSAQSVRDWDSPNGKYADTDGDGYVTGLDTSLVKRYLGLTHTFMPEPLGFASDLPFYFVPNVRSAHRGDHIYFDVFLGNGFNPAIGVSGVTFTLNYDPSKIQVESMDWISNNWLAQHAAYIPLSMVSNTRGAMDAGFLLSNNRAVDGKGRIGRIGIIVEDNIAGFDNNGLGVVGLQITNIGIAGANGQNSILASREIVLPIEKNIKLAGVARDEVNIYPNPATDQINLSLNSNKNLITKVRILDVLGREVKYSPDTAALDIVIDTHSILNGVYFVEIKTTFGIIVRKIQIVK